MARFTHNVDDYEEEEEEEEEENSHETNTSVVGVVVPWNRFYFLSHCNQSTELSTDNASTRWYHNIHSQQDDSVVVRSYCTEKSKRNRSPSSSSSSCFLLLLLLRLMKYILFFILLKVTCQRYMPPPPNPYNSWNDYIHELKASLVNMILLLYYVFFGLVKNIIHDVSYHGQDMLRKLIITYSKSSSSSFPLFWRIVRRSSDWLWMNSLHFLSKIYSTLFFKIFTTYWNQPHDTINSNNFQDRRMTCTFMLPHHHHHHYSHSSLLYHTDVDSTNRHTFAMSWTTTEEYLRNEIIGQEKAIQSIARALDTWLMMKKKKKKPLFLFLTGTQGVGKSHTIQSMTKMLFHHCLEKDSILRDRVLMIHGYDYSSASILSSTSTTTTTSSIPCLEQNTTKSWNHHTNLRQDEEEKEECSTLENNSTTPIIDFYFQDLITKIGQHTIHSNQRGNIIIFNHIQDMFPLLLQRLIAYYYSLQQEEKNLNHHISFYKTLFIFTTDQGSDKIFTLYRKYNNIHHIPYHELQHYIQQDLYPLLLRNRDNDSSHDDENDDEDDDMIPNIIPFLPLTSQDIALIFKNMIQDIGIQYQSIFWKKLIVNERVITHYTDFNYIEYLEFIPKRNYYDSTTSSDSSSSSSTKKKESFIFAKRGGHELQENVFLQTLKAFITKGYMNQREKIAYIDYIESKNELVLRWCNDNYNDDHENDVDAKFHHQHQDYKREQDDYRHCEEGWRGALD